METSRRSGLGMLALGALACGVVVGLVYVAGCGIGVRVDEDIGVKPIELAGPIELARPVEIGSPVKLDALRIDQTVPISIQGPVPISLPGPISISIQGPSTEYEGTYVSEALMEKIQLNDTREDWILAVLGEPTSRATLDDGSEIWRWVYRPAGSQASLVSLLGQGEEKPTPQPITSFVRFKGGVVVDKWRG
ncbi:MAG: hypothetical protein H7Y88_03260 [Phycisphaerales bacterium]|nr:hypothetical protein [Phycisphaerales bacterium]